MLVSVCACEFDYDCQQPVVSEAVVWQLVVGRAVVCGSVLRGAVVCGVVVSWATVCGPWCVGLWCIVLSSTLWPVLLIACPQQRSPPPAPRGAHIVRFSRYACPMMWFVIFFVVF